MLDRKVSYTGARSLLIMSISYFILGPVCRWIGIFETEPKYLGLIQVLDIIDYCLIVISLLWSVWAIGHNARRETNKELTGLGFNISGYQPSDKGKLMPLKPPPKKP